MRQTSRHTLVVVEDPLISNLVRTLFRKQYYAVILANVAEAMDLIHDSEPFEGILVTNRPALFAGLADSLRLLYLSSTPDPELEALFSRCRAVRKPFLPAELVQAVRELEAM
jgi:DNA-binding response OmpR family regulator